MPEQPLVSVIIPVYQSWEKLDVCLQALSTQTYPSERIEIIVVNNEPKDKPRHSIQLPNLHLLHEPKAGSYAARNTGVRFAQGDVLAFCDADCIPVPDWIEQGASYLQSWPQVSRLAGRVKLNLSNGQRCYAELYDKVFAFRQDEYARRGTSATANMFSYRKVFETIGHFREDLFSGGDLEWGRRAQAAGWRIRYAPQVVVGHPARRTVDELAGKARRVCSGYIELHKAHFRNRPWTATYHALCMLKPPLKAGGMILGQTDLSFKEKIVLYCMEYYLKLIQFKEYTRLQMGGQRRR